jgi:hypothetical protein
MLASSSIPGPLMALQSEVNTDEQLNLSAGLAAMLVKRIVLHKNKEAWLGGVDAAESQRKWKATAEERLCSQDKKISADCLQLLVITSSTLTSETMSKLDEKIPKKKTDEIA